MIAVTEMIDFLNTKTEITDIVWNRIFYWLPSEEPTDVYITVDVISDIVISEAESKTRLSFKIIAWNENWKFSDLQAVSENLLNAFYDYTEDNIWKREFKNNYSLYTTNLRKCFQRDVIFYQTY